MDDFNNSYPPVPDGDNHNEAPRQYMPPEQGQQAAHTPSGQQGEQSEPRTPYQTPVQHPAYQPPSGGNPTPPPQMPPRRKRGGKGVIIGLCSVAAACLLFAGGAALGHAFSGGQGPAGSPAQTGAAGDMPTMQISSKPALDPDNYDVVNGLAGEEIYKKVSPSIVSVISTSLNGTGGMGSGVIMTKDGYIITNNHVVTDESTGSRVDKVEVQLSDGTKLTARIVGTDEKTDLAVLKAEPDTPLTAAEFGNSDELQPGEYAYALGSPGGVQLANTITGGRISAINRDITIDDRVMTLIQTDASINPGNSGGALINKYGQVVGITSAKLGISYYEGLGFAIPINTAKEIVDELISTGYIAGRPSIGITGWNLSEQRAQNANVPQGVYVKEVDERAAAYNEGLQTGDIITAIDGQEITTMDEINAIKQEKKAGDTLKIRVYRMTSGQFLDLTITLTDEHDLSDDSEGPYSQQPQQGDGGYSVYGGEDPFSYFFNW